MTEFYYIFLKREKKAPRNKKINNALENHSESLPSKLLQIS